jgi:L-threonylcarbamoyladenylate synthase
LLKHYAPKARLVIMTWRDEPDLGTQLASRSIDPHGVYVLAHTRIPTGGTLSVSVIPHDPEAYARALYAELHRCDADGATTIVVEAVPNTPKWQGIADRLQRAATVPE